MELQSQPYVGYYYDPLTISVEVVSRVKKQEKFTDLIPIFSWRKKEYELFLIVIQKLGAIGYGLAKKSTGVTTGGLRIQFIEYVNFPDAIPESELSILFENNPPENKTLFNAVVWQNIRAHVIKLYPTINEKILELEAKQQASKFYAKNNADTILLFERDAVNLALQISQFEDNLLTQWQKPTTDEVAPFLEGLVSARLTEDVMIIQDSKVFGGWEFLKSDISNAVQFRKNEQILTILYANRTRLESNFGVDLIYYFHEYRSYIMVQYKKKILEFGQYVYRPNNISYQNEIERMKEICSQIKHQNTEDITDYRLNSGLFFFKFCNEDQFDPNSAEMIRGEYYPLELWETFVNSPLALGPKNGIVLNDRNSRRYLSNTKFIDLAEDGWLGSKISDEELITSIIRKSLESGNSVIMANHSIQPFRMQ
jgi:hypothetical protein